MIQIDLITGFLGSGKTTFLKKYVKYLMSQGMRIGILENDYGAVNVDMMLLQDLEGEQCDLEMVAGGCDADCHKRRFKTKLIAMGMLGYDRVIIEPSGIFDMDEFFDVLHEDPLSRWYEIGNVIAIVDAKLEKELSHPSQFMLASQIACAGRVVLSKTQLANVQDIADTLKQCNEALEQFQCKRQLFEMIADTDEKELVGANSEPKAYKQTDGSKESVLIKDWDVLTDQDFDTLLTCGYETTSYVKAYHQDDVGYSSLYYMNQPFEDSRITEIAKSILEDANCGNVFRVKGFVKKADGSWLKLNATKEQISLEPIDKGQEIVIVIGEQLAQENVDVYFN